jgi:putative transposase
MPYCDLRKGRYSAHGMTYHITTVTKGRAPLCADFTLGRVVVRQIKRLQDEGHADTLCFVVMPEHLHWLMVLRGGALSDGVRRLKGRTAQVLGRPVWQPSFYDHAFREDEDLRILARYIVANPLRAGLVERIADYPLWNSVWLDGALSG